MSNIVLDGQNTLIERSSPNDVEGSATDDGGADDADGDDDEVETEVRQLVSLVNGVWATEEVELPVGSNSGYLIDVEGALGFVGGRTQGLAATYAMWAVVPTNGSWEHRDAANQLLWTTQTNALHEVYRLGVTYFDGAVLYGGWVFGEGTVFFGEPSTVMVARSAAASADWNACTLEGGADCTS